MEVEVTLPGLVVPAEPAVVPLAVEKQWREIGLPSWLHLLHYGATVGMDGYGKVERTKDGPMLVIDANPIKEYAKITSQNRYVEYEYSPPHRQGGTRYDSVDPDSVYDETVEAPLDDFANGTFRFVLRPYLVGFDKVQYLFDEDESSYTTSDGGWTDLLGAWDETWMDKMMFNARQSLEKGGLKAMERTMQNDIPNLQEIEDAFVEALQDNNVSSSDF